MPVSDSPRNVVIVGAGPAGLMAAEVLSQAGLRVDVFDAMLSVGRKFLMAGKGGMNITHSEGADTFATRYGTRQNVLQAMLGNFGAAQLRDWIHGLGIETFVGSSGRVFPADMKAAPLLRAWLHRLRANGVQFHVRHRWTGRCERYADERLGVIFTSPAGEVAWQGHAVVLALGGGSWARLGSDGAWVPWLQQQGIGVAPLRPSNCGFDCTWSTHFIERFAGEPLKAVSASCVDESGEWRTRRGECMLTQHGIEGGLIYALSAPLREQIARRGFAEIRLDLLPDHERDRVTAEIAHPRGARSMSTHLQSRLGLKGAKAGLLRECVSKEAFNDVGQLAAAIKSLPLRLTATRPLDEAISSAGGVRFEALDARLMLNALPGVFCAGEMLDWEAPTGGYLLTACFATGRAAAQGVLDWLSP